MESVKLGSRVYYRENGPTDTGTIVDFILAPDDGCFVVKWDDTATDDEKLDRFTGSQLVLIQY